MGVADLFGLDDGSRFALEAEQDQVAFHADHSGRQPRLLDRFFGKEGVSQSVEVVDQMEAGQTLDRLAGDFVLIVLALS